MQRRPLGVGGVCAYLDQYLWLIYVMTIKARCFDNCLPPKASLPMVVIYDLRVCLSETLGPCSNSVTDVLITINCRLIYELLTPHRIQTLKYLFTSNRINKQTPTIDEYFIGECTFTQKQKKREENFPNFPLRVLPYSNRKHLFGTWHRFGLNKQHQTLQIELKHHPVIKVKDYFIAFTQYHQSDAPCNSPPHSQSPILPLTE